MFFGFVTLFVYVFVFVFVFVFITILRMQYQGVYPGALRTNFEFEYEFVFIINLRVGSLFLGIGTKCYLVFQAQLLSQCQSKQFLALRLFYCSNHELIRLSVYGKIHILGTNPFLYMQISFRGPLFHCTHSTKQIDFKHVS